MSKDTVENADEVTTKQPSEDKGVEAPQPTYTQHAFTTQPLAYEFLQWACPSEYFFKVGVEEKSQQKMVLVTVKDV